MTSSAPISVIIPCYRCKETITAAVDSALNQTLPPAEIYLIDDHANDGTLEVLLDLEKTHSAVVKVIKMPINSGPGLARNAGWQAATQPWLAFLDADDIWHPQKLEIQYNWLQAHPNVALCGHLSKMAETQAEHSLELDQGTISSTAISKQKLIYSNQFATRTVMIQTSLPFRFGDKRVSEDYLLWLEVLYSNYQAYRLESNLAFSLRPEFSLGGYSGQLWAQEKRELNSLRVLQHKGYISFFKLVPIMLYSYLKYLRRKLTR
jgi:glycosyltransferase involved in cell wall biosynthesis